MHLTQPSYVELRIRKIIQETSDTKSFILETADGSNIKYEPGQFLTFVFSTATTEDRRSYSISSVAFLGEPLRITVKRIDNGAFSRYLFDSCTEGSPLYTIGAFGFFVLPHNIIEYRHLFFFAAGSGITPIFPLLKQALYNYPSLRVTLLYSNKGRSSTIFLNEIEELRGKFSALRVHYFFSDSPDLFRARLSKSNFSDFLASLKDPYWKSSLFYSCGPHGFMQMINITLIREGVMPANIKREIFDTQKTLRREFPSDQELHDVHIKYAGEEYSYPVQFPDTILHAAKQRGIHLPYSCEAGKCGTCAATCVQGTVWMSYNEVLTERELAEGRVLTCTGYPVGGDIVLKIG